MFGHAYPGAKYPGQAGPDGVAAQILTPDLVTGAWAALAPTVAAGAVTVAPDVVAAGWAALTPVVSIGSSLTPDGGGWDTRLLVASPRRGHLIELEGALVIAVVGAGSLSVTLDEALVATLRNVGVLAMAGDPELAEIMIAGVAGPRAARVRSALVLGDPLITIAEVEAALSEGIGVWHRAEPATATGGGEMKMGTAD